MAQNETLFLQESHAALHTTTRDSQVPVSSGSKPPPPGTKPPPPPPATLGSDRPPHPHTRRQQPLLLTAGNPPQSLNSHPLLHFLTCFIQI
uniref:Uncharacterized protein n=1 Tax=Triticum urartu TaxID=4572 RepID=A0A8R7U937_TRIUA